MDLSRPLAQTLQVRPEQVAATIELLDAGNTVPFIARYRKEVTGGLDDEQLRKLEEGLKSLRALHERRAAIKESIGKQGKLTKELEAQLDAAPTLTALEDLYGPYRPKRRTRAQIAREKGLEPLALTILRQHPQGSPTKHGEEDLSGARDIVAETISDDPLVRGRLRERAQKLGTLTSKKVAKAEDPKGVYQTYYEFSFNVDRIRPHQVLALNRGEKEGVLKLAFDVAEHVWRDAIAQRYRPSPGSPWAGQMQLAVDDAAERLLLPAIERDVRRHLTEEAEKHAIAIFGENLRSLLSGPPLPGRTVVGLDPGFRTGIKVAVVDPTGRVLDATQVYLHQPLQAAETLKKLIAKHKATLVAIGNGTASRETEALTAQILKDAKGVHYVMVNEAGASVYSASALAREELPGMDVTLRGAVSIARRLQDPLAELVKIEPKAIGVGMYQHDVDQSKLTGSLEHVVEDVVNRVGVDVNTASPALLTHVAGIGPKLARNLVEHRDANGAFARRKDLLKVAGLGPKSFLQAAGFLRIRDGKEPLDATAIHPESYPVALRILEKAGLTAKSKDRVQALEPLQRSVKQLAQELQAGEPTVKDILEQLVRPGRDPREDLPAPLLRSDVLAMEDLKPGMELHGTVRNVVDFGAFVDIGVKQDGLIHVSQVPRGQVLRTGEVLEVTVLRIEADRGRISLGLVKR